MNAIRLRIFTAIFLCTTVLLLRAQNGNCNTNESCVMEVLTLSEWKLERSVGLKWSPPCYDESDLYFQFTENYELSIHYKTYHYCNNRKRLIDDKVVLTTKFEIILVEQYDSLKQYGVRIKNVPTYLSLLDDLSQEEIQKINDTVDFQFLSDGGKLVLRANPGDKYEIAVENIFFVN